MTRRFLWFFMMALAGLPAAQTLLRAETTATALAKAAVLENDILYLRAGHVGKNLAEEIQSAQSALAATNKIIGTVLDLRFADGDDAEAAAAAADLLAAKKLPLAILTDGETRDAAVKLAELLRDAHEGLFFWQRHERDKKLGADPAGHRGQCRVGRRARPQGVAPSLNMLSFFNPLSYFAASSAQQERELLADERVALLNKPELMANVLTKIERVLQGCPKERFANRLSASLFLVSPLARRPEILAAHPQIAHRLNNISFASSKPHQKSHHRLATLLLTAVLVSTAVLVGYTAVEAQTSFLQTNHFIIVHNAAAFNPTASQGVIIQNIGPLPPLPNPQNLPNQASSGAFSANAITRAMQIMVPGALPQLECRST